MGIGFGRCGLSKRVALCYAAGFRVTSLLFLNFSKKQAEATLIKALSARDLNLMAGFAR